MADYGEDYLLDKRVKIFQPDDGYRASVDAVFLSALVGSAAPGERILDIGSGTGAVSLCLAHRFPACEITGLEIQPRLVELSSLSAAANGFANLRYLNRDIRRPLPDIANCSFHHVITNPPYAEHDMPSPNPGKAFAHNFRQFDLASWIAFALKMMRPKGHFYMINRTEAVTEILSALRGKAGAITIVPLYSKKVRTPNASSFPPARIRKHLRGFFPDWSFTTTTAPTRQPPSAFSAAANVCLTFGQFDEINDVAFAGNGFLQSNDRLADQSRNRIFGIMLENAGAETALQLVFFPANGIFPSERGLYFIYPDFRVFSGRQIRHHNPKRIVDAAGNRIVLRQRSGQKLRRLPETAARKEGEEKSARFSI